MEVISQFDRLLVFMNLGKRIEEVTFWENVKPKLSWVLTESYHN